MGVILSGDQWLIQFAGIPKFGTTIITTGSKVVHLVGIVVHPSHHLTMCIFKCPVETMHIRELVDLVGIKVMAYP